MQVPIAAALRNATQRWAAEVDSLKQRREQLLGSVRGAAPATPFSGPFAGKADADLRTLRDKLSRGERLDSAGLAGLMNRLKEESINFHSDHELIQRIARRSSSEDISTIFLSAHIEVKTVVVRVSGVSDLEAGDLWPTMVIAFDRMTKLQLAQMTTAAGPRRSAPRRCAARANR
eukprot:gene21320-46876_t